MQRRRILTRGQIGCREVCKSLCRTRTRFALDLAAPRLRFVSLMSQLGSTCLPLPESSLKVQFADVGKTHLSERSGNHALACFPLLGIVALVLTYCKPGADSPVLTVTPVLFPTAAPADPQAMFDQWKDLVTTWKIGGGAKHGQLAWN